MRTSISRIKINAPLSAVWKAITDPEMVKLWQYGSVLTTTWQPGSSIRFRTEWNGQIFEQWGAIIEFDPEHSLKYSLFAPRPGVEDIPENYFFMSYRLESENGVTTLSIIQDDPRAAPLPEGETKEEENPILLGLKELIEKK